MKYYVRTTGERTFNYDIDYELLIDKEHKPVESFINQLKYISNENAVLLEDDLILCQNFKEEIEKAVLKYPNKIINFYTMPLIYYETHESGEFSFNQCTFYPKGIAKEIAEEMEKQYQKTPHDKNYASLENKALQSLSLTHIHYRPCLVQHKDNTSLISKKIIKGIRTTIYFKDWLGKYGIRYEEAFKKENREKLEFEKEKFIKGGEN